MKLTIIVIGDEILLGQVTDTNSGAIARALGPKGWEVVETMVVGDSRQAIIQAVAQAMEQSQLVITTGGLGPTKDDITKRVLADYFGGDMVEDPEVLANVKRVFEKRGLKINDLTLAQAIVPTSCRVIQNQLGTAPIMWFERDGHVLISMPGVPFEMVGMLHSRIVDEVQARFSPDKVYTHRTFMVSGITESGLAEHLAAYEESLPATMHLAYLPVPGYIRLRLDCVEPITETDPQALEHQADMLKAELGSLLLYDGDATPAEILLEMLRKRGLTMATAESCTGGNIAHSITLVPGSSDCFVGGVVSYSNSVKAHVLGVSEADLQAHGAVSEPVVRQMAEGAARVAGADCAVATSGVAGPGGGTPDKPVGTVWMAAHLRGTTIARLYHLPGNRQRVIDRATTEAILLLMGLLRS